MAFLQTSLDVGAAERLTGALAQLILGAPQTADTLDVIDQTLGVVGKFADEAVSEKVDLYVHTYYVH